MAYLTNERAYAPNGGRLRGVETKDPDLIRAVYHLGAFYYQIRRDNGSLADIKVCDDPVDRRKVLKKINWGKSVIVVPSTWH